LGCQSFQFIELARIVKTSRFQAKFPDFGRNLALGFLDRRKSSYIPFCNGLWLISMTGCEGR
jgi:hypothetical protein